MKYEGELNGIPVYSSPDCPSDTLYLLNDDAFDFPRKKDGTYDMRYGVNKLRVLLQTKPLRV